MYCERVVDAEVTCYAASGVHKLHYRHPRVSNRDNLKLDRGRTVIVVVACVRRPRTLMKPLCSSCAFVRISSCALFVRHLHGRAAPLTFFTGPSPTTLGACRHRSISLDRSPNPLRAERPPTQRLTAAATATTPPRRPEHGHTRITVTVIHELMHTGCKLHLRSLLAFRRSLLLEHTRNVSGELHAPLVSAVARARARAPPAVPLPAQHAISRCTRCAPVHPGAPSPSRDTSRTTLAARPRLLYSAHAGAAGRGLLRCRIQPPARTRHAAGHAAYARTHSSSDRIARCCRLLKTLGSPMPVNADIRPRPPRRPALSAARRTSPPGTSSATPSPPAPPPSPPPPDARPTPSAPGAPATTAASALVASPPCPYVSPLAGATALGARAACIANGASASSRSPSATAVPPPAAKTTAAAGAPIGAGTAAAEPSTTRLAASGSTDTDTDMECLGTRAAAAAPPRRPAISTRISSSGSAAPSSSAAPANASSALTYHPTCVAVRCRPSCAPRPCSSARPAGTSPSPPTATRARTAAHAATNSPERAAAASRPPSRSTARARAACAVANSAHTARTCDATSRSPQQRACAVAAAATRASVASYTHA